MSYVQTSVKIVQCVCYYDFSLTTSEHKKHQAHPLIFDAPMTRTQTTD